MADPREQSLPAGVPIDPAAGTRVTDTHNVVDPHAIKIDMGRGPQPAPRPAARPAGAGGGAILISAVLALLCGGAGAWAYERFMPHPGGEKGAADAASPSQAQDSEIQKRIDRLDERLNGLSDQNKQLQARLEKMPGPAPAPDLSPLEQKVARVDALSQQVEDLGKRIEPLSQQLSQARQKIAELGGKLDELRRDGSTASARTAANRGSLDSSVRGAVHPAGEDASPAGDAGSVDAALEPALSRFREGQYKEADEAFRKLTQSNPDDARVWYFAALSHGLATGDWGKATEEMVKEGAEREKAGKPKKSVIDSALAGLTKEKGKEWIDYYRSRATQ